MIVYLLKDNELVPFSIHNSKSFFNETKKLISEGQPVMVVKNKYNTLYTYWESEFFSNPKKYVKDITHSRFVDLKERKWYRSANPENYLYSQGSFDRVIKWKNIFYLPCCFNRG